MKEDFMMITSSSYMIRNIVNMVNTIIYYKKLSKMFSKNYNI